MHYVILQVPDVCAEIEYTYIIYIDAQNLVRFPWVGFRHKLSDIPTEIASGIEIWSLQISDTYL